MTKSKEGFFLILYLKEFLQTPKVHLTNKGFRSLLFGRLIEMPIIGVMWIFSKIPWIGLKMERVIAQNLSKRWSFKPLPNPEVLSGEAQEFKM